MSEPKSPHPLFEAARVRAELTMTQLWVRYLALGGGCDLFTVDAYLHGLVLLPPGQQDILANVINEQLDDLCQAAKVPYLHAVIGRLPPFEDPVDVLDELLGRPPRTNQPRQPDATVR